MTHTAEDVLSAAAVLRQIIAPLVARIEALEQREDAGVWEPGRIYPQWTNVTYDGGLWTAKVETMREPGKGADWRLVVSRGRQGREGKRGPPGPPCRCAARAEDSL